MTNIQILNFSLLFVLLLPYLCTILSKLQPGFDDTYSRTQHAKLYGMYQRAMWAELNNREFIPLFLASIFMIKLNSLEDILINEVIAMVVARLIFNISYILGYVYLRKISFIVALYLVIRIIWQSSNP